MPAKMHWQHKSLDVTAAAVLSAEARILRHPAAAFRQLAEEQGSGRWLLWRRPLLFALMFGCALSIQTSSKLTARLILDGAISFAFVPVFEMASLAVAYRRGARAVSFARAVDLFCAANAPWLVWMLAFSALRLMLTPIRASAPPIWLLWSVELSLLPIAAWSAYIDLQFFRLILQCTEREARRGLIVQRAIGWTCSILYFLGVAIWPDLVGLFAS
jgi:hypothetical protein